MNTKVIEIIAIVIILAFLGAFIIRTIIRKKKREELFKKVEKEFEETKKLYVDSGEALERADHISKNDESITLFNKWYKDYKEYELELHDLETDFEELLSVYSKGQHKVFLEVNKSFNFKVFALNEKIAELHKLLFNYTNYELENTKIALDLKKSYKELENGFELNLAVKEIYTPSFEAEAEKIERELTRFEDLQKMGEYPKARKHLKNATELINGIQQNYSIITTIASLCSSLENSINIIDEVSLRIRERNFRLDQDQYLERYSGLKKQKDEIILELESITFSERVSDDFITSKEREINEIQNSVLEIKNSIESQYSKIKVIEGHIQKNEELFEQNDKLIAGAIEECEQINQLYQMPENKHIQKLSSDIERYNQFKDDYEILLDIVYDLKEDYDSLAERIIQSNEFLIHFLVKLQSTIEGLKSIRIDEIKALENINNYKQSVTLIELYLVNNEHTHQMSNTLKNMLSDAYTKISVLSDLLEVSPLNITEVRKFNIAAERILTDLEKYAQQEIKTKKDSQLLIKFANRFIDDKKSQDLLSHAMTLYNNNNYQTVVKEIRQMIYNDFENPEVLYKDILKSNSFKTIEEYKGEF